MARRPFRETREEVLDLAPHAGAERVEFGPGEKRVGPEVARKFEAGGDGGEPERLRDVEEVVNYVRAMNYGLRRLADLPLSLRLVREIHRELMRGVRGEESTPGEFRRSRNWIGPRRSTLRDALRKPAE